ncbi:MAG: hypothetical protein EXQ48_02900 [Acidobacteria bacterium]|nr:hypothetical protein [Acidobacteriota bacterium]
MRTSLLLLSCFLLPGVFGLLAAQDARPLPDQQALFVATRDNLAKAQREQRYFAYTERRSELRTNPFGRLGTGPTRVTEYVPIEGGAAFMRRRLEWDGKPIADSKAERFEPRQRSMRRPDRSSLEDATNMLEFKVDRRERAGGRSLIVVTFTPRPDAKPRTREGRLARYFAGSLWVDEDLHEIVRIEAAATDTIAYGYGVIARLNEGTQVSVTREQVEPDLWLPVSVRFKGEGRALLFRKLNVDYSVDWFDYRRVAQNAQLPSGQRPN